MHGWLAGALYLRNLELRDENDSLETEHFCAAEIIRHHVDSSLVSESTLDVSFILSARNAG
jgi:hypothetical protein